MEIFTGRQKTKWGKMTSDTRCMAHPYMTAELTRLKAENDELKVTLGRRGDLLRVAAGALRIVDKALGYRPNAEFIKRIEAELA